MLTTAVYLNFSEGERIELRSWRPRNIQMPKTTLTRCYRRRVNKIGLTLAELMADGVA